MPELGSIGFGIFLDRALDGPLSPLLSLRTLGTGSGLRLRLNAVFEELTKEEPGVLTVSMAIERFRTLRGMSQGELARRAEVSRPFISFVENGQRAPSLPMLYTIASALEIPPGALLIAKPSEHRTAWNRLRDELHQLMLDEIIAAWEPESTPAQGLACDSSTLLNIALSPYRSRR